MILEDRRGVDREIQETLGLVPELFKRVPDYLLPTEWASFKNLQLSDQTAIPNKYKELIGPAVSGATRCRYCAYFHTEAARLFGATEDEVTEAALYTAVPAGRWKVTENAIEEELPDGTSAFASGRWLRPTRRRRWTNCTRRSCAREMRASTIRYC